MRHFSKTMEKYEAQLGFDPAFSKFQTYPHYAKTASKGDGQRKGGLRPGWVEPYWKIYEFGNGQTRRF